MQDRSKVLNKEIELIEGCIERMSQNSFLIKGWAITLLSVILALLSENFNQYLVATIVFVITFCFWYLDAFFLRTERLYRCKYEWVIKNRLNTDSFVYDLNPYNKEMWEHDENQNRVVPSVVSVMLSKTLLPIYLPLLFISSLFLVSKC